ncbi:HNH endonuclease signature motif containing protein [Streptomyces niveus]
MRYEDMPLYVRDALEDEGILDSQVIGSGKSILLSVLSGPLMLWGKAKRAPLPMLDGQHRLRPILHASNEPTLNRPGPIEAVKPLLRPEPYAPRRLRARPTTGVRYRMLCSRVDDNEARGKDKNCRQAEVRRRVRSSAARAAVMLRSRGRCENPECLLPDLPYRTNAGAWLLEVDHIDDHAGGGRDHPAAMIALCPNCHSNKTRGADGAVLTEQLRKVAAGLHAAWAVPTQQERRRQAVG